MIERPTGGDADLIVGSAWPSGYDEDKLAAAAAHHDMLFRAVQYEVAPVLARAHASASAMSGALAERAAERAREHIADSGAAALRHQHCAVRIRAFASTVITSKKTIVEAVDTFTAAWARAVAQARANNWNQHEYNQHRSALVAEGRAAVQASCATVAAGHRELTASLHNALEES